MNRVDSGKNARRAGVFFPDQSDFHAVKKAAVIRGRRARGLIRLRVGTFPVMALRVAAINAGFRPVREVRAEGRSSDAFMADLLGPNFRRA